MLYCEPDGEAWTFGQITCPHGDTFGPSIAALAAERRATVERIRARLWSNEVGEMVEPGALDYHWFAADDIAAVLASEIEVVTGESR